MRSSSGQASSTTSAETNRSRGQRAHSPIGISSMKRTSTGPRLAMSTSLGTSSTLTPPMSTQFILSGESIEDPKPASRAARMPASASASVPTRVTAR